MSVTLRAFSKWGDGMESDQINALLAELSEQEQAQFKQLLIELSNSKGDLSALSEEHQLMLATLANKHQPVTEPAIADQADTSSKTQSVTATDQETSEPSLKPVAELAEHSPTDTPFGQYVIEHVKTLCEGGSSLADAVRYAYHNKYLPFQLRDDAVCKDVLQRYQADILTLADSFKSLESAHLADAKLLVGFAWFAVIYDCYQYIEAYGELN